MVGIWANSATFKPELTAKLLSKVNGISSNKAGSAPSTSQSLGTEQKGNFSFSCVAVPSASRPFGFLSRHSSLQKSRMIRLYTSLYSVVLQSGGPGCDNTIRPSPHLQCHDSAIPTKKKEHERKDNCTPASRQRTRMRFRRLQTASLLPIDCT